MEKEALLEEEVIQQHSRLSYPMHQIPSMASSVLLNKANVYTRILAILIERRGQWIFTPQQFAQISILRDLSLAPTGEK